MGQSDFLTWLENRTGKVRAGDDRPAGLVSAHAAKRIAERLPWLNPSKAIDDIASRKALPVARPVDNPDRTIYAVTDGSRWGYMMWDDKNGVLVTVMNGSMRHLTGDGEMLTLDQARERFVKSKITVMFLPGRR